MAKCKTVREFQERFASGEFSPDGVRESGEGAFAKMVDAGWFDWFCEDGELVDRLQPIGKIVSRIADGGRVDLDGWHVFFKNNCPMVGPLYDHMAFNDGNDNRIVVSMFDERREHAYEVYTMETGYSEPTASFDDEDGLVAWLNGNAGKQMPVAELCSAKGLVDSAVGKMIPIRDAIPAGSVDKADLRWAMRKLETASELIGDAMEVLAQW